MNGYSQYDLREFEKWMVKLFGAVCICFGFASISQAAEETKLKIAAIGQATPDVTESRGILAGRTPKIAAAADFHDYICSHNSDGGMLTAIVDAALRQEISDVEYDVSINQGKSAFQEAKAHEDTQMSFPWYRPNCERGSFLTEHTKSLCDNFQWSESLYEVVVGYFSAKGYDRPLRRHPDVFGATLCVPGVEFPQMLHEVGVSDLNTRIIVRKSPAACLIAVKKKEADLALMPVSMAATEIEHLGLEDEIVPHVALDRVLSLHAIAPLTSESAADDVSLLNSGLQKIRKSGEWFNIVQDFADGHDHDHAYDHGILESVATASD